MSIIVPVFNQLPFTVECLETLYGDKEVRGLAEIVIVDNGSTDGTSAYLEAAQERWAGALSSVSLPSNRGFAAACNIGAAKATGPELLFLNNDTITETGWLGSLRKTLAMPEIGLVGPKLLYPGSRTINSAGYVFGDKVGGFYPIYHRYPETFPGVMRRRAFRALLGACVLLRKRTFEDVGGFSEMGLEDIDLCLKVGRLGLQVVYEPRACVLHHGSVTLSNSPPGTIPPTGVMEFSAQWPSLTADDERYYRQDGFVISHVDKGTVYLKEVMTASAALLQRARTAVSTSRTEAEVLLEEAIDCYLRNEDAYKELIALHAERRDGLKALECAERMVENVAESAPARMILARLHASLCNRAAARNTVRKALADWTLSDEWRSAFQEFERQFR